MDTTTDASTPTPTLISRWRRIWKTKRAHAVAGVVLVALIVVVWTMFPVREWLLGLMQGIRGLGWWGPLLFVAIYAVSAVLAVPGSIMSMSAGFLFGFIPGAITASFGSLAGACSAFSIGRTVGRKLVEAKAAASVRFRALDRAVGLRGFRLVFLTRVAPFLPFNMLNYLFGISRVKFRHFFWGSWSGMVPGCLIYSYAGSVAHSLAAVLAGEAALGTTETVALVVGALVTIGIAIAIARITKRALADALADEAVAAAPPRHARHHQQQLQDQKEVDVP